MTAPNARIARPSTPRPRRAGSVLVLVVGVLALLAIIVVVYATVGQSDRRGGAAAADRTRSAGSVAEIADYLAGVIGDDVTKVARQRVEIAANRQADMLYRPAADIPGHDPRLRSVVGEDQPNQRQAGRPWERFNPTGTMPNAWNPTSNTARFDPRIVTSPWLASAKPTRIALSGEQIWNWNATWLEKRDWDNLSNFAPDGRAVNLAFLRGNYAAEAGIGLGADGLPRTSGTYQGQANDAFRGYWHFRPEATDIAAREDQDDKWLRTNFVSDPNIPAYAFTNQINLFRPANDPADEFQVFGDPRYLGNQYADADGDGFIDSRWIELVDASDPANVRSLLRANGDMRFFVAARAVDLSAYVNVNTALEFREPPSRTFPPGLTPGDVDVARLLRMVDFYGVADPGDPVPGNGYERYSQPRTGDPGDWREYINSADLIGRSAFTSFLTHRIAGVVPAGPLAPYPPTPAQSPDGLEFNPDPQFNPLRNDPASGPDPRDLLAAESRFQIYAALYADQGGATLQAYQAANQPVTLVFNTTFKKGDLLELLTYAGLNNAERTSLLESVLDGRYAASNSVNEETLAFGPMRSTRAAERERDLTPLNELTNLNEWNRNYGHDRFGVGLLVEHNNVREYLTTVSGQRPLRPGYLGVQDITDANQRTSPVPALSETDLKVDASQAIDTLARGTRALQVDSPPTGQDRAVLLATLQRQVDDIFRGYVRGLIPEIGLRDPQRTGPARAYRPVWDTLNTAVQSGVFGYRPGFLGNAAEVAYRAAAHLATNLIASRMVETDDQIPADQTILTTALIDEAARTALDNQLTTARRYIRNVAGSYAPRTTPGYVLFPGWSFAGWRTEPLGGADVVDRTAQFAQPRLLAGLTPSAHDPNNPQVSDLPSSAAAGQNLFSAEPLPGGGILGQRVAFNAFGVTPQPVLTGIVTMVMITDAPKLSSGGGGDDEYDAANTGRRPGDPEVFPPITINPEIRRGNPDFLLELVAFEITNPFAVPIELSALPARGQDLGARRSGLPDTAFRYYIEFGGRYYKLVDGGSEGDDRDSIHLAPAGDPSGDDTVTVYATAMPLEEIARRWRVADSSISVQDVRDWIKHQLGKRAAASGGGPAPSRRDPIRILECDPETGETIPVDTRDSGIDLLRREGGNGNFPENRQARLWRVLRVGPEAARGAANNIGNDYLVDRLRDPVDAPASPTLDVALSGGPDPDGLDVASTEAGRQPTGPGTERDALDNTGFSAVLWASVRRPDSSDDLGPEGRNAIPAYMMEVKSSLQESGQRVRPRSLNVAERGPDDLTGAGGATIPRSWFLDSAGAGAGPVDGTIKFADSDGLIRGGSANGRASIFDWITEKPWTRSSENIRRAGTDARVVSAADRPEFKELFNSFTLPGRALYRDLSGAANDIHVPPPMRPGDLLLPLAIGPTWDPTLSVPDTGNDPADPDSLDAQWTTLGEALALAYDYDSPAVLSDAIVPGDSLVRFSPFFRLGAKVGDTPGVLDRGNLVLDRFVPFHDRDADRFLDLASSDPFVDRNDLDPPSTQAPGDNYPLIGYRDDDEKPRWPGIPLALHVLDQFRTSRYGSLSGVVQGTINLNTAPLATLRTIPMLTPDASQLATYDNWLLGSTPHFNPDTETYDLAAAVEAYRDQNVGFTRPPRGEAAGFAVDFRPRNASGDIEARFGGSAASFEERFRWGRQAATRIPGLRESPGFASVGELVAVRMAQIEGPAATAAITAAERSPTTNAFRADVSVDRFGRDNRPLPQGTGANPAQFGLVDLVAGEADTADTYAERLAIANAALGSVSVRSDTFAVWFVVHGYTPKDVEGLLPSPTTANFSTAANNAAFAAPMTPSFKRRYLMVLDRSNVTRAGERPRVLMLEELPD